MSRTTIKRELKTNKLKNISSPALVTFPLGEDGWGLYLTIMNYLKLTVALLSMSMMTGSVNAQKVPSEEELTKVLSYMKRVMLFNQRLPQEKVYLHFDNTGYFKGETIWFTAYVTRADKNNTTDMSKVLYVELVNPSGDVVETKKYPIETSILLALS